MTTALCGMGGTVTVTGATEVTNWSVTQTVDAIDATSMSSSGWVERVGCLKGATGNFRSIGAAASVGAGSGTFKTAAAGGYSISGSIIVTKVAVDTPVDGIVSYTHDFNFTGEITVS